MLVDDCGNGMGWTSASVRGGWSTPGGCRNSAMSFGGSVPSLHPTGSIRSLRSQHSMQPPPETPRRCIHCHPVHVPSTPNNYMQHPMQYYTPTHCMEGQNGTYTPHRGSSYHGDTRLRYIDGDESMGANTNWVLGDLRSLHRCVPALRRTGIDVAGMRTHFYPEGGWGWLVCAAGFLALLLTTGMQLAFGMLYLYAIRHLGDVYLMDIESEYKDQYTAAFLKNGIIRGITYQIKILTWVTWKMLSKKDAEWWLGTEVRDARGFHDLVLKYVNNAADEDRKTSDKKYMYRFVQIKHMTCLTGGTKIDLRRLLSTDKEYCQYSLIYLFKSYMHMIDRFEKITPEQIVDMTVFTNRDINTSLKFLVPVKRDEIFDFEEKGKRYRFDLDILRKTPNVIIERLRAMSRNDETRVWSFLSKLVFAVGQPSEPELEGLITKNMGKIFNTPQIFYNDLFKNVMDWFLILEKGNAPYLTEEYINKHLKKMVDMLLAEKKSDTSFTADSLSLSNLSLT